MRKQNLFKTLIISFVCASLVFGNSTASFALTYKEDEEFLEEDFVDEEGADEELVDTWSDEDDSGADDYSDDEDDYIDAYGSELSFDSGDYGYDHRIETYLFIGTDDSGNESGESGVDYRGGMADFLTLLVIDHTDDSFGFLEIDRNTIVLMPVSTIDGEVSAYDKLPICYSHYFGTDPENSCDNTVEVVCEYLGELETIDGYYALNMDHIGALADEVGGVEVTLEDDMTYIDPSFVSGATVLLKGDQAEAYCRARMNVGEGDNASRMRRQRAYMRAFYDKSMELLKKDTHFVSDLYKLMKELAVTNISGNDVSRIAEAMRKSENKGIFGIEGETKIEVSNADDEEHEAFYPEESSIIEALTELFSLKDLTSDEDEDEVEDLA